MRFLKPSWTILINLALVCLTIVGCAIGAEIYLRKERSWIYPMKHGWVGEFHNRPSPNFITDEQTGWRMRPNHSFEWTLDEQTRTYIANSQGFRSPSDFNGADRRFKIAFVGDSFTFGTGVSDEEVFPTVTASAGPGRVAWNFAMPGFGVDQVWLSGRYQALPLKPDLLVVGLINADFERSQVPFRRLEGFAKPTFKLAHGRLTQRVNETPPNPLMRYLDEYSLGWALYQRALRWVSVQYSYGEYWTLNQAIIDALREDCRKAGVPVLFLYIPIKGLAPLPALAAHMHRTGANYIDLTEQRPVPPVSIYLPHDAHLSVEGHRYVAGLIEHWLKDHPSTVLRAQQ